MHTQPIQFFDGSYAQASYRGRSSMPVVKKPNRAVGIAFAVAVLFSTAAGAFGDNPIRFVQTVIGSHSLHAGGGLIEIGGNAFAVAMY
jgi:hypothetical protein